MEYVYESTLKTLKDFKKAWWYWWWEAGRRWGAGRGTRGGTRVVSSHNINFKGPSCMNLQIAKWSHCLASLNAHNFITLSQACGNVDTLQVDIFLHPWLLLRARNRFQIESQVPGSHGCLVGTLRLS